VIIVSSGICLTSVLGNTDAVVGVKSSFLFC
jgi:hypothetical protein